MKGMLIGAALTLIGTVFGFAFATKIDALAEAKWWDLMTAFGTVGAAIVALGLALRAEVLQQRREHAAGLTVLRAVSAECSQTKTFVWQALQTLQEAVDASDGAAPPHCELALQMAQKGLQLDLTRSLLPNLHLIGDAARSDAAAKAVGLIHAFRHGLEMVSKLLPFLNEPTRETFRLLMGMGMELDRSLEVVIARTKIMEDLRIHPAQKA
jgi:hypothetical protein